NLPDRPAGLAEHADHSGGRWRIGGVNDDRAGWEKGSQIVRHITATAGFTAIHADDRKVVIETDEGCLGQMIRKPSIHSYGIVKDNGLEIGEQRFDPGQHGLDPPAVIFEDYDEVGHVGFPSSLSHV